MPQYLHAQNSKSDNQTKVASEPSSQFQQTHHFVPLEDRICTLNTTRRKPQWNQYNISAHLIFLPIIMISTILNSSQDGVLHYAKCSWMTYIWRKSLNIFTEAENSSTHCIKANNHFRLICSLWYKECLAKSRPKQVTGEVKQNNSSQKHNGRHTVQRVTKWLTSIDNEIQKVKDLLCCPSILWNTKLNTNQLYLYISWRKRLQIASVHGTLNLYKEIQAGRYKLQKRKLKPGVFVRVKTIKM
jgi:hypothetical protein